MNHDLINTEKKDEPCECDKCKHDDVEECIDNECECCSDDTDHLIE